jgi:hypothetical protein
MQFALLKKRPRPWFSANRTNSVQRINHFEQPSGQSSPEKPPSLVQTTLANGIEGTKIRKALRHSKRRRHQFQNVCTKKPRAVREKRP